MSILAFRATQKPSKSTATRSIVMVAIYEIIKGAVALVFAGVVAIWHNTLMKEIAHFAQWLHHIMGQLLVAQIDNLIHYSQVADKNWIIAVTVIIGYALLRFIEAYGLLKDRDWAYWLSIVGYMVFLPLEIYDVLIKPFNWVHVLVFIFNILIVVLVFHSMRQKGFFHRLSL